MPEHLRRGHDPTHPARHARRLTSASPATGHYLLASRESPPQNPASRPAAGPDRYGTPPSCSARTPIGCKRLQEIATIATPDTLLRWYHRLIAQKFDGSRHRRHLGQPRVPEEIEQLVVRMAEENPAWGYRRIQGALANLGHHIDAMTVRNILRRHHLDPAPTRRQAGMRWGQFLKLH